MASIIRDFEPVSKAMQDMVQRSTKERAASLRWQMTSLLAVYILTIVIFFLDRNDLKFLHVLIISITGLASIFVFSYLRERKLTRNESEYLKTIIPDNTTRRIEMQPGVMDSPDCSLTPRELEVLVHVIQGEPDKEIANKLELSQYTVKNHLRNIYQKLDVRDRTSASVLALNSGWIKLNREDEEDHFLNRSKLSKQTV